ncbi:MAG: hypothetical protein JWM80_5468 [Cyanobacteria bacterium RYN_339]|nr:hypothetical protein [Cyanobacteria bacterium RYN_339]
MRTSRPIMLAATLAVLAQGCGPTVPDSVAALNKPPGIANLLRERVRSDLTNGAPSAAAFKFPGRVRIIPYDFKTELQTVDQLAEMQGLADALKKRPELFSDVSVLPDAYGDSIGASFDGLLKLAASTRADAFLLVSGRTSVSAATEKSPGFFDWWAHKSFYEAHTSLDALYVEAPSGHYLPSLQAAGKGGPTLVVPDDNTTGSAAYGLKRSVENQAFKNLADALTAQLLSELKASGPSATPTPAPSTKVDAAGTPAGSPSPSPTPTSTPTPKASADAAGTPAASPTPTASPT